MEGNNEIRSTPAKATFSVTKETLDVDPETVGKIEKQLGLTFVTEKRETGNVCLANSPEVRDEYKDTFTAKDLRNYVYAVLHSSGDFENDPEPSKIDGVEVPYPDDSDHFWKLTGIGVQPRQLHPLEYRSASFATQVVDFHKGLRLSKTLPKGIKVLNPFKDNKEILGTANTFYHKYYDDINERKIIVGINPGRLGAGVTGIPFTDTKRLSEICGIEVGSVKTHEPSSVFIYDLIEKFGGPEKFYGEYYINSVCPLGFIERNKKGNWVNCNYYDYQELFLALKSFIISSLKKQIGFGINTTTCYVLGKKNAKFVRSINKETRFFDTIVALDHPRYIVQYKAKDKEAYIDEYLEALRLS